MGEVTTKSSTPRRCTVRLATPWELVMQCAVGKVAATTGPTWILASNLPEDSLCERLQQPVLHAHTSATQRGHEKAVQEVLLPVVKVEEKVEKALHPHAAAQRGHEKAVQEVALPAVEVQVEKARCRWLELIDDVLHLAFEAAYETIGFGIYRQSIDDEISEHDAEIAAFALHRMDCQRQAGLREREQAALWRKRRDAREPLYQVRWLLLQHVARKPPTPPPVDDDEDEVPSFGGLPDGFEAPSGPPSRPPTPAHFWPTQSTDFSQSLFGLDERTPVNDRVLERLKSRSHNMGQERNWRLTLMRKRTQREKARKLALQYRTTMFLEDTEVNVTEFLSNIKPKARDELSRPTEGSVGTRLSTKDAGNQSDMQYPKARLARMLLYGNPTVSTPEEREILRNILAEIESLEVDFDDVVQTIIPNVRTQPGLLDLFTDADEDKSGSLSVEELLAVLQRSGFFPQNKEVAETLMEVIPGAKNHQNMEGKLLMDRVSISLSYFKVVGPLLQAQYETCLLHGVFITTSHMEDLTDIEMAQEVAAKHTAEEEEAILGLTAASTTSLPTEFELLEGVTRVDLNNSLASLAEAMQHLTTKETKDTEVPPDVDMSTQSGSAHGDQGSGSTKDHTAVLSIVKADETVSKFDGYQLELPTFPTRLTPLLRNMTVGDLHALLEVFQTKVIPAATFPRLLECYGLNMQRLKHEEMWRLGLSAKINSAPLETDETPLWSDQVQKILESNHLLSTATLNWISESDKTEAMEQQLFFKSLIQKQLNPCPNSRLLEDVAECKLDLFHMVEETSSADADVDYPTTQPQLARKLPPGSMERKLAILESLNNTYMGQVRCWGGRWVKVWQPLEIPSWAPLNDTASAPLWDVTPASPLLSAFFHIRVRKEVRTFLAEMGLTQMPESSSVWKDLYREIGKFLAAQTFLTHCPPEVMTLPVAAIRDSKSHLRERAVCDERISLPLSAFRSLDSIYSKLVSAVGSQQALIDVKVNWRCNNVLWWGVVLEETEAVEFYRHVHSSALFGC
eukprot:s199_g27.t1